MFDFNALLDKIKNPIFLIIAGVVIYFTSDMWYVKLPGALIIIAGFSILTEKPIDELKIRISNRRYSRKKERDAKNHLNYLEKENDNNGLFIKFLKVLLSQDTRSFNREDLVNFLGDDYKGYYEIEDYVFGEGSDSILHNLVREGIINTYRSQRLLGEYSVSVDYWEGLRELYPEIHKLKKITFDSVYKDIFSKLKYSGGLHR